MFDLHARRTGIAVLIAFAAIDAAPAAAKTQTAERTPQLSGAQQLARISEQTGGGHLAIINSKRYVRYLDGRLGRVPTVAKLRVVQRTPQEIVSEPGFAQLSGAQQLARISEQTGGGHLAIINGRRYVRYPDGTLVGV